MSAHNFKIELSDDAVADFQDILTYTFETWGSDQFIEYRDKIDRALELIATSPEIGRNRYGFMVHAAGKHQIFYRLMGEVIFVVRILHQKMDPLRHLT